ncbi:TMEM175 family protein [Streptococcus sp. H31]|uniref:TMEM175 family protein n=1 Tax=Streptococcus huangxiaojuni TaxID=3237239 RepID=UPI0034A1F78B
MDKERLVAFTDAMLAIIMTVLVLDLDRPQQMTWSALWDLRTNFFAYTISFFWLGTMWVNLHRTWDNISGINSRLVWNSVVLLFCASFFPYTTDLVAGNFNSSVAQAVYGLVVLAVTACNVWMFFELGHLDRQAVEEEGFNILDRAGWLDVVIKITGLVLTLTVWPQAMMWAVLLTAFAIVLPRSIR